MTRRDRRQITDAELTQLAAAYQRRMDEAPDAITRTWWARSRREILGEQARRLIARAQEEER